MTSGLVVIPRHHFGGGSSPCVRASTCIRPSQPAQKTGFLGSGPSPVRRVLLPQRLRSTGTHGAIVSPCARVMRLACPPPASRVSSSPPRVVGPGLREFVSLPSRAFAGVHCAERAYSEKAKVCAPAERCLMGYIDCVGAPVVREGHMCEASPRVPCCLPSLAVAHLADSFSGVMPYFGCQPWCLVAQQH